jgi:hypothetical protein
MHPGHHYHTAIERRRLAATWIYPVFRKSISACSTPNFLMKQSRELWRKHAAIGSMQSLGPEKHKFCFALLESSPPKIDISFPFGASKRLQSSLRHRFVIKISIGIAALLLDFCLISITSAQDTKLPTITVGYAAISGSFAPLWMAP